MATTGPCPNNKTQWTDEPLQKHETRIKALHINELRNAINRERQRRGLSSWNWSESVSSGTIIKTIHVKEIYKATKDTDTHHILTWTIDYDHFTTDTKILADHIEELRKNINQLEVECICDCNYCTCDCNYCTCNCNYCTCNCNYCTCDCNYACTCDCNYCTCNCNYCTCNCNYACTCNCNY